MDKLKRRGILFVLSSPSGAGKTSIARYILDKDKNIKLSVSLTTRKKEKTKKLVLIMILSLKIYLKKK